MNNLKHRKLFRFLSVWLVLNFIIYLLLPPQFTRAQALSLPEPGQMINVTGAFSLPRLIGVTLHPENPTQFDFLIDSGNDRLQGAAFKEESNKIIKYFLAALTVPETELWVNLSPYEKNRIIADGLGRTAMGRDLLAQDYILKQLTASLLHPENPVGKTFWDQVYKIVQERYGNVDIPVDTFNKVWIVPDQADIYEKDTSAFIVASHLKVMLEEDYLTLQNNKEPPSAASKDAAVNKIGSDAVRNVILPVLEQEVNTGKNFALLRQMYQAMILATWYKMKLKDSLLSQIYVDQNKTKGIDLKDNNVKDQIYQQYLQAFRQGVYDFTKVEEDPLTGDILTRKYFSGGFTVSSPALSFRKVLRIVPAGLTVLLALSNVSRVVAQVNTNPLTTETQTNPVVLKNILDASIPRLEIKPVKPMTNDQIHRAATALGALPRFFMDSNNKNTGDKMRIILNNPGWNGAVNGPQVTLTAPEVKEVISVYDPKDPTNAQAGLYVWHGPKDNPKKLVFFIPIPKGQITDDSIPENFYKELGDKDFGNLPPSVQFGIKAKALYPNVDKMLELIKNLGVPGWDHPRLNPAGDQIRFYFNEKGTEWIFLTNLLDAQKGPDGALYILNVDNGKPKTSILKPITGAKPKTAKDLQQYIIEDSPETPAAFKTIIQQIEGNPAAKTPTGILPDGTPLQAAPANTAVSSPASNVGGIDFNAKLLNMQIKRDLNGMPLPVKQQPIFNLKIDGLYPVIFQIQPIEMKQLLR
ncbi:MAG: hypothetical protein HQL23_00930 [Candidatus Omnitrophica bacterium]|nr:hypothetical protein [Candidatus Omnitrophota bacterium]